MVCRPSCGQIESNIFSVHMTGRQLLPRCASPRRLLSPGPGPAAARCDSFVSFEKLSVNDFHGWPAPDYQNIYLNCHNILKHSPIKSLQLWNVKIHTLHWRESGIKEASRSSTSSVYCVLPIGNNRKIFMLTNMPLSKYQDIHVWSSNNSTNELTGYMLQCCIYCNIAFQNYSRPGGLDSVTADTGLSPPAADCGHWPPSVGVNISIEAGDIMSSESKYWTSRNEKCGSYFFGLMWWSAHFFRMTPKNLDRS